MLERQTRSGWLSLRRLLIAAGAALLVDIPCATAQLGCGGDCDGDNEVTVNEAITLVNIALGNTDVSACAAGDADGNGAITINEIIAAVNNLLSGCPSAEPSPTTSSAPPPTDTPAQPSPTLSVALPTNTPVQPSATATVAPPTQTPTASATPPPTEPPTTTPTPTPATVMIEGVCESGLDRCPQGTQVRILRCRNSNRAGCLTDAADLVGVAGVTGTAGEFFFTTADVQVAQATLLFEAEVAPQTMYRLVNFGSVAGGANAGGGRAATVRSVRIGPDSEAATRLLDEAGLETFDQSETEDVFQTVERETAALPPMLRQLNIETPIEVATAYTGQADANLEVRGLLGLPMDNFLSVRLTTMGGCVETGQSQRIVHGGFQSFSFIITDSLEGRESGQALSQVDEYFVVLQRRNDGSARVFARSSAYGRTQTGPFRDQLSVGSFNGTGTLNLEVQIHVKRTDVGPIPTPSGATCSVGDATQTCTKCTIPLLLQ